MFVHTLKESKGDILRDNTINNLRDNRRGPISHRDLLQTIFLLLIIWTTDISYRDQMNFSHLVANKRFSPYIGDTIFNRTQTRWRFSIPRILLMYVCSAIFSSFTNWFQNYFFIAFSVAPMGSHCHQTIHFM